MMLSRVFRSKSFSALIRLRGYTIMAAKSSRAAESNTPPASLESDAAAEKVKEVYWMRDPKTGNWMPENYINKEEADPAELRNRLINSKEKKSK